MINGILPHNITTSFKNIMAFLKNNNQKMSKLCCPIFLNFYLFFFFILPFSFSLFHSIISPFISHFFFFFSFHFFFFRSFFFFFFLLYLSFLHSILSYSSPFFLPSPPPPLRSEHLYILTTFQVCSLTLQVCFFCC